LLNRDIRQILQRVAGNVNFHYGAFEGLSATRIGAAPAPDPIKDGRATITSRQFLVLPFGDSSIA
jgi:hypothetical protein